MYSPQIGTIPRTYDLTMYHHYRGASGWNINHWDRLEKLLIHLSSVHFYAKSSFVSERQFSMYTGVHPVQGKDYCCWEAKRRPFIQEGKLLFCCCAERRVKCCGWRTCWVLFKPFFLTLKGPLPSLRLPSQPRGTFTIPFWTRSDNGTARMERETEVDVRLFLAVAFPLWTEKTLTALGSNKIIPESTGFPKKENRGGQ